MSGSVNKVILIGNLGQEAEIKSTQGGALVATISLACSESYLDSNGRKIEKTEWVRCVAWNKLAENLQKYVHKGDKLYVEGKLATRTWDGTDGQKHYATEVIVNNMTMLTAKNQGQQAPQAETAPQHQPAAPQTAPAPQQQYQQPPQQGPQYPQRPPQRAAQPARYGQPVQQAPAEDYSEVPF